MGCHIMHGRPKPLGLTAAAPSYTPMLFARAHPKQSTQATVLRLLGQLLARQSQLPLLCHLQAQRTYLSAQNTYLTSDYLQYLC